MYAAIFILKTNSAREEYLWRLVQLQSLSVIQIRHLFIKLLLINLINPKRKNISLSYDDINPLKHFNK